MKFQRKLQIFISSTYTDLIRERQVAVSAILENGHIPAGMELFAAGDEEQMQVIRRWIDNSDIFILLLGKRYGSIESKSKKSYTHLEYEYAIQRKIPFFAIVLSDSFFNAKVKNGEGLETFSEKSNPAKFSEFYNLVTSKMCSFADDEKDIKLKIWQSIRDLEFRHEFNGWVSAQEIPDNTKVIEDFSSMVNKVSQLQDENNRLKDKINKLESTSKEKEKFDGRTFEELVRLLQDTKVTLKIEKQKEVTITLLKALNTLSSTLASGVSNAATSSENERQIFYEVARPLVVYGIMQADKTPSGVHWKRFALSDLGKRFLYQLRTTIKDVQPKEEKQKNVKESSKQPNKKRSSDYPTEQIFEREGARQASI